MHVRSSHSMYTFCISSKSLEQAIDISLGNLVAVESLDDSG